ncbi:MAG: hypothetical protein IJU42_00790 [Erysipelotrichaceae bacterium]|nr:hypothetical protein [Erysipelotrichaceae bacterium]
MRNKYASCGLNYDIILERYPNISEYEEIVNAYLDDEFFEQLEGMLDSEDYAMAKDAVKGLYILASELCLFPLYERLLEVYEDLEYEMYGDVMSHCQDVIDYHKRIRGIFNV